MTPQVVLILHFVIGCGAAIAVIAQERAVGGVRGAKAAALMVLFWPFLLPSSFLAEPDVSSPPREPSSDRSRRIEDVGVALRDAWQRSDAGETRERAVTEGFLEKLRRQELRLRELETTIDTAAESIRPKLEKLRASTSSEIDQGLALLEEMVAQLTLLRFAGLAESDDAGGERDRVEGLLIRIEALADVKA